MCSRRMRIDEANKVLSEVAPGSVALEVTKLLGGVSALTESIRFRTAKGVERRLVVRRPTEYLRTLDPGGLEREWAMLGLAQQGGLAVPERIHFDARGDLLGEPCMVVEHIDGEAVFAVDDVVSYARQVGMALARVHELPVAEARHLRSVNVPSPVGRVESDEVLAAARERVLAWGGWGDERIAVLHGDFWPGNLLWRDGRLVGIIDWEDACLGDPLADVAISRLDLLWLFGEEAAQCFTEAYGSRCVIDPERLALWDLRAALRPGEQLPLWASAYVDKGRSDITAEHMRVKQLRFAEAALGRVPIR